MTPPRLVLAFLVFGVHYVGAVVVLLKRPFDPANRALFPFLTLLGVLNAGRIIGAVTNGTALEDRIAFAGSAAVYFVAVGWIVVTIGGFFPVTRLASPGRAYVVVTLLAARAARVLPPEVVDGGRGRPAGRRLEDGGRHLRARGQPLHLRLLPLPRLGGAPGRREAARPGRARRGHPLHRPLHLPARHPRRRRRRPAPAGLGALVGLGPLPARPHRRRDALPPLRGRPPHPAERLVRHRLRHPRRPPPRGRAGPHGARGARLARPAGDAHDGPRRRPPLPRLRPAAKEGADRPRPEVPAGGVRPGAARDRRRRRPEGRGRGPGGRRPPPPRGRPQAGPAGLLGLRARVAGRADPPGHDRRPGRRPRAGPDGGPPDVGPGRIAEHVPSPSRPTAATRPTPRGSSRTRSGPPDSPPRCPSSRETASRSGSSPSARSGRGRRTSRRSGRSSVRSPGTSPSPSKGPR